MGCVISSTDVPTPSTPVHCSVNLQHRKQIAVNHSATHLLHSVLAKASFPDSGKKQSLQTGSHITSTSFTFDFYAGFLTKRLKEDLGGFIQEVENQMNELARAGRIGVAFVRIDLPIQRKDLSPAALKALPRHSFVGDIARLSRKDSVVHTISIGEQSREFCCGISLWKYFHIGQHAASTADCYPFLISSIQSVAAGIKRIEAKVGRAAVDALLEQQHILRDVVTTCQSSEKEIVKKVTAQQKQLSAISQLNTTLMKEILEQIQPSYQIQKNSVKLAVFEVGDDMSKEFTEKLINKVKNQCADQSCLIVQNKSFSLVCQQGLSAEAIEKMKNVLFSVGIGGNCYV